MESIEIPLQKFPLSDSPNRFVEVAQHPKFPERYGEVTRVLLINPVQVDLDHIDMNIAKNRRYYVYPPYALGILNTLTRRRGIECRIIDLNYEAFSFIKMVENPTSGDLKAHLDSVLMSMILEFSPIGWYKLYVHDESRKHGSHLSLCTRLRLSYFRCCRRRPCD